MTGKRFLFYISLFLLTIFQSGCATPPIGTTVRDPDLESSARVEGQSLPATQPVLPPNTYTPKPTVISEPTPDHFIQVYPLSANSYTIPLSVRHVTQDSAILFFELQVPQQGALFYRCLETNMQGQIEFQAQTARHLLTIEGLDPGNEYEVMVLLGSPEGRLEQPGFSSQAWGIVNFHTDSEHWPLRVGVLGDASFGDQATQDLVDLMSQQDLDFVIHTGDVVYEVDSADIFNSYLFKFFQPFSPLLHRGPIYTVLGNHDYDLSVRWNGVPFYDYAFPSFQLPLQDKTDQGRSNQYYAFEYRDIQFLMLDTHVFAGGEGRAEQDVWMQERLADPRYRFTIPVFHVAPYSSSIVHPDDRLPILYSWNWQFEEAKVPLALSGHYHHYERSIANGITYIVSGGGSSTLYAQGDLLPESQIYVRKTHYVLLEIYEETIELTAIGLGGEILDQALIHLK